jgi:peroxiredoxin
MPDEIHNFAHNNEWLTRNLIYLGRVQDALVQSRNLVSMPRHPKYNSLTERGSYRYGRVRLLQTLTEFELWKALLEEAQGPFLLPSEDRGWQNERLAWMAVAQYLTDNEAEGKSLDWQLRERRIELESQQIELERQIFAVGKEASDQAEQQAAEKKEGEGEEADAEQKEKPNKEQLEKDLRKLEGDLRELNEFIALEKAAAAVRAKDVKKYQEWIEKAGRVDGTLKASLLSRAGDHKGAIESLEKIVKDSPSQLRPVAALTRALWLADRKEDAAKRFEELRKLASFADLETPLLAELVDVAKHAGIEGDWRVAYEQPNDLGERPELDSLGPFRWSPYAAPRWSATNAAGETVSDDELQGRPRIVIFYLGFGCLHCVEQLDKFKPMVDQFREAGIEIVGISTESLEDFQKGLTRYEDNVPFQLLANPDHQSFHNYRCWDDFEDQPLHGTFLIDAAGQVRWQDISYEPFTDADFLLDEAKRLLALLE